MATRGERIEYIKHLNTLSSGSIVLLATFLDKVFDHPRVPYLAAFAVTTLLLSVGGAIGAYSFEILFNEQALRTGWLRRTDFAFTLMMWLGFLAGIACLGLFAILNLV